MKKNKSKFKNVEDKIEDTDKKLCEFKSLIEQIKTEVEELCPDEVEGNKQAQKILQDMITNMMLMKGIEEGEGIQKVRVSAAIKNKEDIERALMETVILRYLELKEKNEKSRLAEVEGYVEEKNTDTRSIIKKSD